jgi:hypothetical protein
VFFVCHFQKFYKVNSDIVSMQQKLQQQGDIKLRKNNPMFVGAAVMFVAVLVVNSAMFQVDSVNAAQVASEWPFNFRL